MSKPIMVLIGGSGFLGRHIARDFHRQGWRILIVSRDPNRARETLGDQYEYILSLRHIYDSMRIDLVINLAGASVGTGRWTEQRKQELLHSRLQPTQALSAWLQERGSSLPRMIIQASAVGYYGNGSKEGWPLCDEHAPPQSVFVSELCRKWEEAAFQTHTASKVPTAVCRLGVVLAKDGGILPQLLKPVSFCIGRIGSGQQPLSWVHVDDVLGGIRFLAAHNAPPAWQIYNFTAPVSCTQYAFAQTAARLMHRPLLFSVPEKIMRLAMGEQADLVVDGQFVVPKALQQAGYLHRFPDISAALSELID